jgi:two-component system cell cycle sensor histidine kinase/response regulator CckA
VTAKSRRILVAEDSPTQAERIRYVLEGEGYQVEVVRNGRTGLEAVKASRPDLIVSDVVMPEMDGFAFCQAIKSAAATRQIPFVLLTSQQTPMDILHGLELGADNFIPKPFEDTHLLERIRRIVENLERRKKGALEMEVTVRVGGREIVVNTDKQQMIELLFSTSEELSGSNKQLEEARLALEEQARGLERVVEERTQALQQQRAFLRQVVDLNPSFIFAKDRQGRFTLVNRAVAEAYGTTVDALLGKTDADFNPNPEEVEAFRRDDEEVFVSGEDKITEEPITDAAGQRRWLYTVKRALVGAEGVADQILGVATDITERKKAEDQLRQAQKMEAVGQLAGGVAHDFNNLLGVIIGYADLLQKDIGPQHPGMRRLEQIHKASGRAIALTRQLLAFSRKQVLQPRVLDLNAVVGEVEKMLARLIGEDIQISTVLAPQLGRVKADPGQVEQVIVNLAVNARDAMPGGGKLIIETGNVELDDNYLRHHAGARPGPHVVLAVSDTGHGMDAETLARIFEPFFTTKEQGKGTGLGLSTVYGIVKQSGGYVMVYSEPGRGTTFRVYLPRVEEAAEDVTDAPAPSEPPPAMGETILLAEDAEALRSMIREILEEGGYTVVEGGNAEEALAAARAHQGPIHLMLSDVVMPRMGGRDLATEVEAIRPGLRVLYMSGYTDEAIVHHGVLDAGTHFLPKPFTADGLLRKIRSVLDGA